MNWNNWIRQIHRWLSIAFTATVVATGAWRRSAMLKLAAAEIDIAGLVFASADDAVDRGEIVRKAMVQLAGGVDRAIFVGDGLWDVATASRLGLGILGIGSGEWAAELRGAGAC